MEVLLWIFVRKHCQYCWYWNRWPSTSDKRAHSMQRQWCSLTNIWFIRTVWSDWRNCMLLNIAEVWYQICILFEGQLNTYPLRSVYCSYMMHAYCNCLHILHLYLYHFSIVPRVRNKHIIIINNNDEDNRNIIIEVLMLIIIIMLIMMMMMMMMMITITISITTIRMIMMINLMLLLITKGILFQGDTLWVIWYNWQFRCRDMWKFVDNENFNQTEDIYSKIFVR